jgi:PKD repeat protein
MKKIYPLLLSMLAMAAAIPGFSQHHQCGTTKAMNRLIAQHPEIKLNQQKIEAEIQDFIANKYSQRTGNQVYIIPIVFHIIHQNGVENISDAQVQDAVRILNEDFRKQNADTSQIVPAFQSVAADCEIEFRLAQIDPDGNCTNGIDRIYSHETNIGDDGSKLNRWPREKYLNVWVVRDMESGVAGYAYYPGATTGILLAYDGIIIRHDYIGSIGTSNTFSSRTLTHEVGHYLNLAHTWGSTNEPGVGCDDDGVFDTPVTKGWTSCNLSGAECDPLIVENVQNYMEYAYCSRMFTEGQKQRMIATLNSPTAQRDQLWSQANLIATGVLTQPPVICSPIAAFHAGSNFVCEGSPITFYDDSYNAPVSSRTWTFTNGTPATSTAANPSVVFSGGGYQTVTLTVTNASGTDSKTSSSEVYVSPVYWAHFGTHTESFESASSINEWLVRNDDLDAVSWQRVTNAGATGSASIRINNYSNDGGCKDEIISPAFDLSTTTGLALSFKLSCASRETDPAKITDVLRVYSSTDCGKTWQVRLTRQGPALCNAGYWAPYYVPSSPAQWTTVSVPLPNFLMQQNVRFKFQLTAGSGEGNNLYIDDINIEGVTGLNDPAASTTAMSIFPNPSNGTFSLQYYNEASASVAVKVYDITGRAVRTLPQGEQSKGEHQVTLAKEQLMLTPGIYFIELQKGKSRIVQKLVITD